MADDPSALILNNPVGRIFQAIDQRALNLSQALELSPEGRQQLPRLRRRVDLLKAKAGLATAFQQIDSDPNAKQRAAGLIPQTIDNAEDLLLFLAFRTRRRLVGRQFQAFTDLERPKGPKAQLVNEIMSIGRGMGVADRGSLRKLGLDVLSAITFNRAEEVPLPLRDQFNQTRARLAGLAFEEEHPVLAGITSPLIGAQQQIVNFGEGLADLVASFIGQDIPDGTFNDAIASFTTALNPFAPEDEELRSLAALGSQRIGVDERSAGGVQIAKGIGDLTGIVLTFKGALRGGKSPSLVNKLFGLEKTAQASLATQFTRAQKVNQWLRHAGANFTVGFLMGQGRVRGLEEGLSTKFAEKFKQGALEGVTVVGLGALGGLGRKGVDKALGRWAEETGGRFAAFKFLESVAETAPWAFADPAIQDDFIQGRWKEMGIKILPMLTVFGGMNMRGAFGSERRRRSDLREIDQLLKGGYDKQERELTDAVMQSVASRAKDVELTDRTFRLMLFQRALEVESGVDKNLGDSIKRFAKSSGLGIRETDFDRADLLILNDLEQAMQFTFDKAIRIDQLRGETPFEKSVAEFTEYGRHLARQQGRHAESFETFLLEALRTAVQNRDARVSGDTGARITELRKQTRARSDKLKGQRFPATEKILEQLGADRKDIDLLEFNDLERLDAVQRWVLDNDKVKSTDITDPRTRELVAMGRTFRAFGNELGIEVPSIEVELAVRSSFKPLAKMRSSTAKDSIEYLINVMVPRLEKQNLIDPFLEKIERMEPSKARPSLRQDKLDIRNQILAKLETLPRDMSDAEAVMEMFQQTSGESDGRQPAAREPLSESQVDKVLLWMSQRMNSFEFERELSAFGPENPMTRGDALRILDGFMGRRAPRNLDDLSSEQSRALRLVVEAINRQPSQVDSDFGLAVLSQLRDHLPPTPEIRRRLQSFSQKGTAGDRARHLLRELAINAFTMPVTDLRRSAHGQSSRDLIPPRERALADRLFLMELARAATRDGAEALSRKDAIAIEFFGRNMGIELSGRDLAGRSLDRIEGLVADRVGAREVREAQLQRQAEPSVEAEPEVRTFARDVLEALGDVSETGRSGSDKVFISEAFEVFKNRNPQSRMKLEQFKQKLVEANQAGELSLARADFVEGMNPDLVRESEVALVPGSKTAVANFIRVTEPPPRERVAEETLFPEPTGAPRETLARTKSEIKEDGETIGKLIERSETSEGNILENLSTLREAGEIELFQRSGKAQRFEIDGELFTHVRRIEPVDRRGTFAGFESAELGQVASALAKGGRLTVSELDLLRRVGEAAGLKLSAADLRQPQQVERLRGIFARDPQALALSGGERAEPLETRAKKIAKTYQAQLGIDLSTETAHGAVKERAFRFLDIFTGKVRETIEESFETGERLRKSNATPIDDLVGLSDQAVRDVINEAGPNKIDPRIPLPTVEDARIVDRSLEAHAPLERQLKDLRYLLAQQEMIENQRGRLEEEGTNVVEVYRELVAERARAINDQLGKVNTELLRRTVRLSENLSERGARERRDVLFHEADSHDGTRVLGADRRRLLFDDVGSFALASASGEGFKLVPTTVVVEGRPKVFWDIRNADGWGFRIEDPGLIRAEWARAQFEQGRAHVFEISEGWFRHQFENLKLETKQRYDVRRRTLPKSFEDIGCGCVNTWQQKDRSFFEIAKKIFSPAFKLYAGFFDNMVDIYSKTLDATKLSAVEKRIFQRPIFRHFWMGAQNQREYWTAAGKVTRGGFKNDLGAGGALDPVQNFGSRIFDVLTGARKLRDRRTENLLQELYHPVRGVLAGIKAGSLVDRVLYALGEMDTLTASQWLSRIGDKNLESRYLRLKVVNEKLRQDLGRELQARFDRGEISEQVAKKIGLAETQPFGMIEGWMPRLLKALPKHVALEVFGPEVIEMTKEMSPARWKSRVWQPSDVLKSATPDQAFRRKVKDGEHYIRSAVAAYHVIIPRMYHWMFTSQARSAIIPNYDGPLGGARNFLQGRTMADVTDVSHGDLLYKPNPAQAKKGLVENESHLVIANNVNDRTIVATELSAGRPVGNEVTIAYERLMKDFGVRKVGIREFGQPAEKLGQLSAGSRLLVSKIPQQLNRVEALERWMKDIFSFEEATRFQKISEAISGAQYHLLLGLMSPQAAMTNLTQLLFTVFRAGPTASLKGINAMLTNRAIALPDGSKVKAFDLMRAHGAAFDTAFQRLVKKMSPEELAGVAEGAEARTLETRGDRNLKDLSFVLFDTSEKFVRGATWLTGFQQAVENGMVVQDAVRYARQLEAQTMFQYDRAYSPRFLRNRKLSFATTLTTFTHRAISEGVQSFASIRNLEPSKRFEFAKSYITGMLGVAAASYFAEELSEFLLGKAVSISSLTGTRVQNIPLFGSMIDTGLLEAGIPDKLPEPLAAAFRGRVIPGIPSAGIGPSPAVELLVDYFGALRDWVEKKDPSTFKEVTRRRRTLITGRMPRMLLELMQIGEWYLAQDREDQAADVFSVAQGPVQKLAQESAGLIDHIGPAKNDPITGLPPEKPLARFLDGRQRQTFGAAEMLVDLLFPGSLPQIDEVWDFGRRVRLESDRLQTLRDQGFRLFQEYLNTGDHKRYRQFEAWAGNNARKMGWRTGRDVENFLMARIETNFQSPTVRQLNQLNLSSQIRILKSPEGLTFLQGRPQEAAAVLFGIAQTEAELTERVRKGDLDAAEARDWVNLVSQLGAVLQARAQQASQVR